GHRLQDRRRPAVLPPVARPVGGRGHGHDRARVHRADLQGTADGVRARAQPPHRPADGRGGRVRVDIETLTLKGLDQDAVRAWSRALGDPDWFLARRLEALAALGKLEGPTNRGEAWRFTDP